MEKKTFKTLIKLNEELVLNAYIRGRITGIMEVTCNVKKHYAVAGFDKGFILRCDCTPNQYKKFREMIENDYPGLCVFDYQEESL